MTVYVDQLAQHGGKRWCHVIADTEDELHRVARSCGLRREWFQPSPPASFPHYDAQRRIRARLVAAGAIECTRRELVGHMSRIRKARAEVANGRD